MGSVDSFFCRLRDFRALWYSPAFPESGAEMTPADGAGGGDPFGVC
jgi:hypothetical protein